MSRPVPFVLERRRAELADGPLVVAHRGDSRHCPENTVAAFRAASTAGVAMQEFDVQQTRDGVLVCLHDSTLDRTTDAPTKLGPGALLAQTTWPVLQALDAGGWHGPNHRGERVPSLAAALACMRGSCVPLIEHKAGTAVAFVRELEHGNAVEECILQSFDWQFVYQARALAPRLALAVLGPTSQFAQLDAQAIAAARQCGASLVHWQDRSLSATAVDAAHAAGLWVCSYTTDDELGWHGGSRLGLDAMCTNDPAAMLACRSAGRLRRTAAP